MRIGLHVQKSNEKMELSKSNEDRIAVLDVWQQDTGLQTVSTNRDVQ